MIETDKAFMAGMIIGAMIVVVSLIVGHLFL